MRMRLCKTEGSVARELKPARKEYFDVFSRENFDPLDRGEFVLISKIIELRHL